MEILRNSSDLLKMDEIAPYLTNLVKFSWGVKVRNWGAGPGVAGPQPTLKKKPGRPEDKDSNNTLRFLNV